MPDETITGLELLMKLSPKDQKRLVSKLLNKELPIDPSPKAQQEPPLRCPAPALPPRVYSFSFSFHQFFVIKVIA